MGLFDNLFKPRPEDAVERIVEAPLKATVHPEKRTSKNADVPDPEAAFLQPKGYAAARASDSLGAKEQGFVPVLPGPRRTPPPERRPAPAEDPTGGLTHVTLTVGDVLPRLPVGVLRPGPHDLKRPLRFRMEHLSQDIARGKPGIALSVIAAQCPEIFAREIGDDDDMEVRLPLQKIVEQVSRHRAGVAGSKTTKFELPPGPARLTPQPFPAAPKAKAPAPPAPSRPEIAPPVVPAPAPTPAPEPAPVAITPPAPQAPQAPEVPGPAAPAAEAPATTPEPVAPAAELSPTPVETPEPPAAEVPAIEAAPPPAPTEAAPSPVSAAEPPPVEAAPAPEPAPPAPVAFVPPAEAAPVAEPPPAEPEPIAHAEAAPEPEPEPVFDAPARRSSIPPQIELGLAALVAKLPPELLVAGRPAIDESVRLSLPFPPIEKQLGTGQVLVSAAVFWEAVPPLLRHYFVSRDDVRIDVPLEEIFQNLPVAAPPPRLESLTATPPLPLAPEPPVILAPPPILADEATAELDFENAPTAEAPLAPEPATAEPAPAEPVPPPALEPAPVAEEPAPVAEAPAAAEQPAPDAQPALVHLQPVRTFSPGPSLENLVGASAETAAPVVLNFSAAGTPPATDAPILEPMDHARTEAADVPGPEAAQEEAPMFPAPLPEPAAAPAPRLEVLPTPPVEPETVAFTPDQPPPLTVEPEAPRVAVLHATVGQAPVAPEPTPATLQAQPPRSFRPIVLPPPIANHPRESAPVLAPVLTGSGTNAPGFVSLAPASVGDQPAPQILFPASGAPVPPPVRFPAPPVAPAPAAPTTPPAAPKAEAPKLEEAPVPRPMPEALPQRPQPAVENAITLDVSQPAAEPVATPPPAAPAAIAPPRATPAPVAPPVPPSLVRSEPPTPAPETTVGELHLHIPPLPSAHEAPAPVEPHPPALPISRFDQHSLQSLFMTDETLDLPKIARLAAMLPGIQACVISSHGESYTGGNLPAGFDVATLRGLSPQVGAAADRLPIGELKNFTLYGGQFSVSFFGRSAVSLCAVHRARAFIPGVREKLAAVVDELARPAQS